MTQTVTPFFNCLDQFFKIAKCMTPLQYPAFKVPSPPTTLTPAQLLFVGLIPNNWKRAVFFFDQYQYVRFSP